MIYYNLSLNKTNAEDKAVTLWSKTLATAFTKQLDKASLYRIGPHPDSTSGLAVPKRKLEAFEEVMQLENGEKIVYIPNTVAFWEAMERPDMVQKFKITASEYETLSKRE